MDPKHITKPVVLRRRSANYPGRGRRIHGIVFDHPSMPKIMAVSSVVRPLATNHGPSSRRGDNPKRYATTTTTAATQHGSPPALIHSPTTPMPKCRSPYDGAPCLPNSDTSRQPCHAESRSPSYQQMWSPGQTPNYAPPSTSLANTLNTEARPALGSEGTSMAEHSRSYFQQEKSMVRRADPTSRNQNGRHEPTSARDEVDRHFELPRQPMAPHVSRGNPETVADHPHPRGNPETVAYTRANPEAVPHHPHPRGNLETAAHPRGNPETVSYSRGNSEAVAHYAHLRGNPETVAHTRGNPEAVAHHPYPRGNPETVAHPRGNPEKVAYTYENTETVAYTRGNPEAVANHPHSRGNPEAVASHPRIVTQSPSHGPYFQTPPRTACHSQYSPSFSNAAQLGNARFYLAQHVTRRNSTGTLRHYPSNVNGGGGAASEFEPRYGDERHVDFSRQFHHNVLLESHPTPPQGHHHVAGTPPSRFVAPTSVTSTKKPSLIRQSSVPAGVSTFSADQFRRRATWDSYSVTEPIAKVPAAMAPATGEKDPGFYRPPSQTSEVVTSPTWTTRESTQYTRKRSGCEDTTEDTEDRLGYRDTPEYTKGWSGYTNIPENTKGRWEPEDTLARKKLERTKRRRLRKKESSTVVVISDSENEEELEDGNFLETLPDGDWDDSGSDVFPLGKCEEQSPVKPVILLGGLVTNKTKVKSEHVSEHVSEHDKTTRFDSAYWTSDSRERDLDSRKGRLRSVVSEDENTKDSSEKKSVVLGERGLCTRVKSETNVKHCIDVCEKSFVEDFRVTSENTSRSVVNIRRSSSSRQCHLNNNDLNNNDLNNNARSSNGGKIATDDDRKMPLSYREPAELPVSVNTVRAKEMAVHSKLGGNICRSKKATREAEYGCEPSRIAKCSYCQYYGCSSERGNFYLPQKNPSDVSETCAACPLRNRSSSPTFGLLSRPLSKLTNDEMQTQIKKGECIVGAGPNGENTRGRETREGKSPYGVRAEVIYGTDKIPGNLQVSTKTETPGARDECNRRSCDYSTDKYECPGTKCKLSDATSQKAIYKPTGIVVGVKKDLRVEELLVSKTVDEFGKHDGEKTKGDQETNDGSENAEKAATRNEFSRGFGVLQFSVVEKDVGANWRNGHECPKSHSDEVNATQQWQAYSVKLERGSTMKQCDKVLGQVRREEVYRRGGAEQSVLKYMRQGEVLRDLDTKERDVPGITDANSTHQDTSAPKVGKKCEKDTFAASAFQNAKSVDAKNVGDSRETRELSRKECNVVVRKRSSSFDAYDDCGRTRSPEKRQKIIEGNFERDGSDCDGDCARTYSVEESKRQRTIEGSVNGGEYTGNTSTANCEGMAKLSISDQPIIANHIQKTNYTHIAPRPEAQNAAAVEEPAEVNAIESRQKTSERSNDPGDVSPDKKSPVDGAKLPEKKGGALTASEWKEILIGRIEQVRESIETEQTPWKTKNKMKVLKKLENQLAWWGEEDEQAFLSRKLQFFQTMRNQYELMKEIGAQRRTSTKNTGKKVPEWTTAATMGNNPKTKVLKVANVTKAKKQSKWTAMGDNPKTKVLKVANVTKAKKQSKVAKKTSTSTGKKRGRPLKKVKNVEA